MEELDVMMIPEDSPRGYILEYNLVKYYFYYLYIQNIIFLSYILEYPRDFTKCDVSFLHFMIYIKITCLHLNISR